MERLFGFSKDDLNIFPLSVHKDETLRGFFPLQFINLTVFVLLKKDIGKKHTVRETLLSMGNLKCKVYDDEILVWELTKQQKDVIKRLDIMVSKKI